MRQRPGLCLPILCFTKLEQRLIIEFEILNIIFCRLCVKVLNDDKKLWEDEVYKFARKHQLEVRLGFVHSIRKITLPNSDYHTSSFCLYYLENSFDSVFLHQAIAPYIPTSTVKLSSAIYEMVLYDFLKKDDKVTGLTLSSTIGKYDWLFY